MPTFSVSLRLPAIFDEAFFALIPQHRTFINRLIAEQVIQAYAITADRGRGWVVLNGEDELAVRRIVESFPLYAFLEILEIDELFIFDIAAAQFPTISLN
ncbi:hypothetical protein [Hymenobacter baengnokdamensis]|uniref:hypothetical protein n=1 Tax=Hymenobacter baengnokdamensis TaxID=2615203 RepID=UPI001245FB60|nr:hypothetical protein [Hymenobacter baengnokdamensis]